MLTLILITDDSACMIKRTTVKEVKEAIRRSSILKALCVSSLAVLFALVLYYPLGSLLPYIGVDRNNSFYINKYYSRINKSKVDAVNQEAITVINTQSFNDNDARSSIADLLCAVCKNNPLAVGVDIRFTSRRDSINDEKLINTIRRFSHQIVLAQASHGGEILPSILPEDSLIFGITNLPDYYSFIPFTSVNGISKPLFSYQLSTVAGAEDNQKLDHFLVNYASRSFNSINATKFLAASVDIQQDLVCGKVVIIGDIDNAKDYHYSPFPIQGDNWSPGVLLHAYATYSLLVRKDSLKTWPLWANFLLCFLLCSIFAYVFVSLFDKLTYGKSALIERHYTIFTLIRPVSLLLIDGAIYFVCLYLLTLPFGIIPDVVLYMISVLLINFFNDFVTNRLNA